MENTKIKEALKVGELYIREWDHSQSKKDLKLVDQAHAEHQKMWDLLKAVQNDLEKHSEVTVETGTDIFRFFKELEE